MFTLKRILFGAALLSGVVLAIGGVAAVRAQNVTTGYKTDEVLRKGMIVRLNPKDPKKVEALTPQHAADMLGVVVASNDAPFSLSDADGSSEVFVAAVGQYPVLVSTQNGGIKAGDMISISSVKGVGMRGDSFQSVVLGKALQSFSDATNSVESTTSLTDSNGKKTEVALGRIMVDVTVAHNPNYSGEAIPGVPRFIARAAEIVTDKPVQAVRIYAGLGILLLSLLTAGWILYAGIHTGMVSVGRNPLAKKTIMRNLVRVTLMSLIIVVLGTIAVYLLLRV